MTTRRMDHVGLVVSDLSAAVAFFVELGLEREGEASVEGEWADRLLALDGVRADIAMLRTPDGRSRVELSTFRHPVGTTPSPRAPVNTPGIPRLTFVVDDVDEVIARLRGHGAELVGEVAQYADAYRYGYVRGPEGVILGLVEELRSPRPAEGEPGDQPSDTQVFAGLPVRDLAAALAWYATFFGRPADELVGEEAMWQVSESTWLYIAPDTGRAGGGLVTLGLPSLEPYLSRWQAAGLTHEPVETYDNGVRHVTIIDPDGNSVSLAEAPGMPQP